MTSKRRHGAALNPDCIERHAVISTGHVSQATAAMLDAGAEDLPMSCYPPEYGWLVPTGISAEAEPDVPTDLWAVMQLAKRSDCAWILFDRDGPMVGDLETFEW